MSTEGENPLPAPAVVPIAPEGVAETPLDHARRLLAPFLDANPLAKVEQVVAPREGIAVIGAWDDTSFFIRVPDEVGPFANALNSIFLPPRFTAIYHRDTKALEVIWSAYKLPPPGSDIIARSFKFSLDGHDYECEFTRSSDRLLTLAKGLELTGTTSTSYRNLQSFSLYANTKVESRSKGHIAQILGDPVSFWVRSVDWDNDKMVSLARHLNFYMSYYDNQSPYIVVHEPKAEKSIKPRTRFVIGKFPPEIRGQEIDDNLLHFWAAGMQGDPARRFLYCYRIIEHAATLYIDAAARANIRKALASPHALNDLEGLTDIVVSAIHGSKLDTFAKHQALIRDTVNPKLLWDEMQNNLDAFMSVASFDGGYVLEPLIGKNAKEEDFKANGISLFSAAIWNIRNALSHGKDQKTGQVIAPTQRNFDRLEPWVHLISVAAGEVILYEKTL